MQVFKGSSFWAVGLFGLFASVLLSLTLFTPAAHASGEQFTYGSGTPPGTMTVSGGTRNIPSTVLTLIDGTDNRYSGNFSIPVDNPSSTNTTCPYTVVVNVDAPGSTSGTAGYSSNISSCFDPTFDDAVTIQAAAAPPTCPDGYTLTTDQANCIGQPNADGACDGGGTLVEFPAGSGRSRCEIAPTPGTGGGATPDSGEQVQCTTESGLSWLICPALDIVMWANTTMANILDGLLEVSPLEAGGDSAVIFQTWSNLRNLANVVLIFVLFAVIFSQATSSGISAYGIKRIIPRLVAGAILINISYFICAIAVDIFNILGFGIKDLVLSTLQTPAGFDGGSEVEGLVYGIGFGVALVGLGAAVVVGLWVLLSSVLLVLLIGLLTLAIRQALIVLLVILAPLAFAAWILPNTEKYFDKWKDLFINLLVMFPLIMLVFAAARVASTITTSGASRFESGEAEIIQALGLLIAVLPIVALPFLFKLAGGAISRIYSAMSGSRMASGATSKVDQWKGNTAFSRGQQIRQQAKKERKNADFVKRITGDTKGWRAGAARRAAMGATLTKNQQSDASEVTRRAYAEARKERGEKISRATNELSDANFLSTLSNFKVADDSGKLVDIGNDKRGALLALAAGRQVEVTDQNGSKKEFKATNDNFLQYAALNDIAKTGDAGGVDVARRMATGGVHKISGSDASGASVEVELNTNALASSTNKELRDFASAFKSDVNNVISENAGGLVSKMPDLVKGKNAAFDGPGAAELASWHPSTVKRAGEYISELRTTNPTKAAEVSGRIESALKQALANNNYSGNFTPQHLANFESAGVMTVAAAEAHRASRGGAGGPTPPGPTPTPGPTPPPGPTPGPTPRGPFGGT